MSELTHDEIREILPDYALSLLDQSERAQVVAHLAGCPSCRAELADYTTVVDKLPLAAPIVDPSPALKARLRQRIAPAPQPAAVSWWERLFGRSAPARWQPVLALAALVLLLSVVVIWQLAGRDANSQITLSPTDAAPAASGLINIAADGRTATLAVTGLPELPADQQYQLWLIVDGQRQSGAIFSVDEGGGATVPIDAARPLAEYGAFGITVEPAGGSPGPTGARVLGYGL
ncbi:MAG: anti-sigma factor [Ardenticatenales bacterium]|nr:anti-sigma factor [Ardenticatenales bacterium]